MTDKVAAPLLESPHRATAGVSYLIAQVRRRNLGVLPILFGLGLIWVYFQTQSKYFLTPRNLDNLILQASVLGVVAVGVVLVLLIAEIDLSVGSLLGVSAALIGVLVARSGWPWWLAVIVAFAVVSLIGALQGAWSALFGIPTFVVTLAGFLGWLGVQLHILGNLGTVNVTDPQVLWIMSTHLPKTVGWLLVAVIVVSAFLIAWRRRLGRGRDGLVVESWKSLILRSIAFLAVASLVVGVLNAWQGIPTAGVILITVIAGFAWVVNRTQFGRYIMAVGGNPEAARRAGINVAKIRIYVLTLSGLLAAIGGLMTVSRQAAASTQAGSGTFLLEVIAAAVIGGTSLFGGRGTVWSALVGAVIMASLSNGLDLTGQAADVKYIVEMCVLLLAVTVDAVSRRSVVRFGR